MAVSKGGGLAPPSPGYERGKGGKNISIFVLVLKASNRPKWFIYEVLCIISGSGRLSPGKREGHILGFSKNIKEILIKRLPLIC